MTQEKSKRILVGGGAGYIGTELVPYLQKKGYIVDVIDLLWFGNHLPKSINVKKKDLFDCTEEDFRGYDAFIFLAGLSNDPMAEHSPSKNFIFNAALPAYLAYLAKRVGVKRYIYASSCSVYGFTENKVFDEKAPATCTYPYGISKLQGEQGVMHLVDDSFSAISLRQGTVSGFSGRMRMDLMINTMLKNALMTGKITVNNPSIWRPVYDIRDCIEAFHLALKAPKKLSGVFNVASGNYSVGEIGNRVAARVTKITGQKVLVDIKQLQDMRNYKVSIARAKKMLKFKPLYMPEDIVDNVLKNLKSIGDMEKDRYYNIRVFKDIAKREEVAKEKIAAIDAFKY